MTCVNAFRRVFLTSKIIDLLICQEFIKVSNDLFILQKYLCVV